MPEIYSDCGSKDLQEKRTSSTRGVMSAIKRRKRKSIGGEKMEHCPECGARAREDEFSPEVIDDGQGYEQVEIHTYKCERCGCAFKVTITTKKEKIGGEQEDG